MNLLRYLDFIFEANTTGKLQLCYSNEFRDILVKISNKSEISKTLISTESKKDVEDGYTLIDITDSNDKISFIQANRILKGNPLIDNNSLPTSVRYKQFGSEYWIKSRSEMGIGRWTKHIFTDVLKLDISNVELEKFINLYKSTYDGENNIFEVVSGEDIRKYYLFSNNLNSNGQLGKSCMRYKECQSYLDIYVKNPEVCKLLILKSEEDPTKITGRSLLWETSEGKYQDRIYTNFDSDILSFKQWADANGYQKFPVNTYSMEVKLGDHNYTNYPYMDTFKCYNPKTKTLSSNIDLWPDHGYIKIEETDGSFISNDVVWSDWENNYINRDDAVYCKNIEDWTYQRDALYLEYLDEYAAATDDIVYSDYDDQNYYESDTVYSSYLNAHLYKKLANLIEIIDSDGTIDYAVKERDDLYISNDDGINYSRKYYLKNPYTNVYQLFNEKTAKDLNNKILKEFGYEDINKLKADFIGMLQNLKMTDKIEEEIKNNKYWKSIFSTYYGYSKDTMPKVNDAFIILKSYMSVIAFRRSEAFKIAYNEQNGDKAALEIIGSYSDICIKVDKLIKTFDFSLFPPEIYKRYMSNYLAKNFLF